MKKKKGPIYVADLQKTPTKTRKKKTQATKSFVSETAAYRFVSDRLNAATASDATERLYQFSNCFVNEVRKRISSLSFVRQPEKTVDSLNERFGWILKRKPVIWAWTPVSQGFVNLVETICV